MALALMQSSNVQLKLRIRNAIKELVKAEIAYNWKGNGGPPGEDLWLKQELDKAKKKLTQALNML